MNRLLRHAFWLAPLLVFAAFVSYFLVFVRFPLLRDFPWVNLPLILAGLALALAGLRFTWPRAGRWLRLFHAAAAAFSLAVTALFCAYVFVLSSRMPDTPRAAAPMSPAPAFSLPSATGDSVRLADFQDQTVVLVFYRGFW